jgi:hypothetical protein
LPGAAPEIIAGKVAPIRNAGTNRAVRLTTIRKKVSPAWLSTDSASEVKTPDSISNRAGDRSTNKPIDSSSRTYGMSEGRRRLKNRPPTKLPKPSPPINTAMIIAAALSELPTTTINMRFQVTSATRHAAPEAKKAT